MREIGIFTGENRERGAGRERQRENESEKGNKIEKQKINLFSIKTFIFDWSVNRNGDRNAYETNWESELVVKERQRHQKTYSNQ